jgi:polyhydroxyalkanoate synthesis regulator phasin
MKKLAVITFFAMIFALFSISLSTLSVWAAEVDVLIKKLVEKGILTQSEANELLKETKKEAAREKTEIEEVAKKTVRKERVKLPKWVEKMNLKGDVRLRYEYNDTDFAETRTRGRIRWRLSGKAKVVDKVKVGFGLASGGDDPRSTNQSFDSTFSSKGVRLDLAYAEYKPAKWATFWGGKFSNPLYRPRDLLWDSDIRPEGVAANGDWRVAPNIDLIFTPAFYVLEEVSGTTKDPYMYALDAGIRWKITNNVPFTIVGTYYGFNNLQGTNLTFSGDSNTRVGGNLVFDYDSVALQAELGFRNLGILPFLGFFGQYIKNDDPPEEDKGWLAGFLIGHKKVENFAQWLLRWDYRRLERDAWLDAFPDSDFFGGDTNVKGWEVLLEFGLARNTVIQADYYQNETILGTPKVEQKLLQVDLVLKF